MKKIAKVTLTTLFVLAVWSASSYAGMVSGTVKFDGAAPEAAVISMDADPTCAGAHSESVLSEEVVVGDAGALQNVFVYVKEGLEGQTFDTPSTPVTLDQKGCQYKPHVFGVQVGQPVDIINSDPTLHNVHGLPKNSKEFNLGMPIPGMRVKRKFDSAEVMVKFKCDVHPWMNAYVGVVSHPFFSTTGSDGSFEIKDLPAGSYVLEAWHEKYGTQTMNVTVDDAAPQSASFTFTG
ncbi:MAG: carboxypeptidase regulatory-like domain-containing protein [Candidatus Omnitrophota bacterium]|nr:carboxypeptidase regulatory-like domain-containing protein [Candidatus Omnitrophota bacterium]